VSFQLCGNLEVPSAFAGTDVVGDTCIMTTKAEYQHYSRECLQWAARVETEKERQVFLKMADAWTRIALVRNDMTVQFAADTNGAKQQIHS
jgi:hypothetical protein